MNTRSRVVATAKKLVGRVLARLPEGLAARVLPGQYRFHPDEVPALVSLEARRPTLVIAPTNYAGQGFRWASAVRERDVAQSLSIAVAMPGDFAHEVDVRVPVGVYAASTRWSRDTRRLIADFATHVLVEAGRRPFGAVLTESLNDQVQWMLARGIRVGYLAHGSDLRLPSTHVAREPESPFAHGLAGEFDRWQSIVRDNLTLIAEHGLPTFVSTPDLLLDAPDATWLPVVIDPVAWRSSSPVLERPVPLVVHAPSRGVVKGSELVDAALTPLVEAGLIDYRRISGVPHHEMPTAYRDADIVLDQFRVGDYGVAACEAMAAGRLVISHVSASARAAVKSEVGESLPILESTASDLQATLRQVLDDRETARALAARGPEVVANLHDGSRSATVLEAFLSR